MRPLSMIDMMREYCRISGKYAMLLTFTMPEASEIDAWFPEIYKAAPYLKGRTLGERSDFLDIITNEQGVLVFDTKEEMDRYYDQTVGDDGPTKLNPYDGPGRVGALTCGPRGLINENT